MKKKRTYIFLLVFFVFTAFSQTGKKDSLLNLINNSKDSATKINESIKLLIEYNHLGDLKNAILFGEKALKLAIKNHDTLSVIIILNSLGNTHSNQGATNEAINYYKEALALSEKTNDTLYINVLYGTLGAEYTKEGDTKKAIVYLKKGLHYNISRNKKKSCAGFYNNLGILYRNEGKYNLAIDNYFKSIEICKEVNDKRVLMQTYNNLAFVYYNIKSLENAKLYYSNSLALADELHDQFQEGIVLGNIGTVYLDEKQYSLAEASFVRALKIAEEINDLEGEVENNLSLSKVYEATGKLDKSIAHLKTYIDKSTKLIEINNEMDRQAQELKSDYEIEKLAIKKEQEKRDLINNSEKKRQRFVIYSVSFGFVIVAILLLFLYKRFKLTNSQKIIIQEQKQKVEEHQKEILDSFHYASRIQKALLPSEKYIEKKLNDRAN